jgi:hypothetical protein
LIAADAICPRCGGPASRPFLKVYCNRCDRGGAVANLGSVEDLELEMARREAARIEASDATGGVRQRVAQLLSDVHPEARACIDDTAPLVAVRGTRRSGKSRSFIRKMLDTATAVPHARVIYINETLPECEAIAWIGNGRDGLLTLNEQFQLGGVANNTKHTLTFPNGGMIRLVGADDRRQIAKLRGIAPHLVVIDEAQKAPHLTELIRDSLGPAMMDHGGQIFMPGTPGVDLSGLFYDVTNEEEPLAGWSVHVLNVLANPFFGSTEQERFDNTVARYCREQALPLDAPEVQREWFGKWVKEDARFVFAIHQVPEHEVCYAPQRMRPDARPDLPAALKDLPRGPEWRFTLFCDLGYFPDPFAYVLWAWSWEWPELLEVASWSRQKMDSDEQLSELTWVAEQTHPSLVGGDIGGAATPIGKGWAKRWEERFGYGMVEAQKGRKFEHIQLFNTDLRKGRIKLRKDSPLHTQMQKVQWLPSTGTGALKENPRFPNDVTDAGLYGHRHTFAFLAQAKPAKPEPGSSAFYEKLEQQLEQADLDELEQPVDSYYGESYG